GSVARGAASALLRRQLDGRQRRLLTDVARGDLIDRDAAVRRMALSGRHTAEPRGRRDRVHGRALGRLVAEPAHDREVLPERLERLENRLEVEVLAFDIGRPAVELV